MHLYQVSAQHHASVSSMHPPPRRAVLFREGCSEAVCGSLGGGSMSDPSEMCELSAPSLHT